MRAQVLPVPGIVLGVYPERRTGARERDAQRSERWRATGRVFGHSDLALQLVRV
jgi:hypothetical protein